ncbi:hypothetical protein, partial [Klebsiella pneumoniae]
NNQMVTTPALPTIFTPEQGVAKEVLVGFRQTEVDSHDFVEVQATILGLPEGVSPQRYRFCYGQYQYTLMLESTPHLQTLAMPMAPGQ